MDNPFKKRSPTGLYAAFLASRRAKVLLVDDDAESRTPLAATLRRVGYEVIEALGIAHVFDALGAPLQSCSPNELPDLIIADADVLGDDGWDRILSHLKKAQRDTPMILLSVTRHLERHSQRMFMRRAFLFDKQIGVEEVRTAALCLVSP